MSTDVRAMIERGYKTFPLQDGSKLPACKWQDDKIFTVDEDQNYGINCGKSGLVVIDIDGEQGIEAFEQMLGDKEWPKTFTVQTPSGGYHLYFNGTGYQNTVRKIAPSVDTRANGGYVVGPGSRVDGKTYDIINNSDVQDLPVWLVQRLDPNFTPTASLWAFERQLQPINGQDDQLARDVWLWRRQGYEKHEAKEKWLAKVEELPLEDPSWPWTEKDFERHWKGADRKITKQEVAETEQIKQTVGLFEYKFFDELDDTPFTYRIDGLLPDKCNILFSAQYKAGKTTTAVNVVHAFTSHDDMFGEFHVDMVAGNVIYVNLELDEIMFRQYGEEAGLSRKHLRILNLRGKASHVKIMHDDFVDMWASELKKLDTEILVVDPLSVIMSVNGFDSDNNDGARRVLEQFGHVQALAGIDHVMIIDHSGHSQPGRSRGASSKMDWPDVIWSQEKNGSENTRKFKAYGRGVDEKTFTIAKNPDTKRIETTIIDDADGGDERMIIGAISRNPHISTPALAEKTGFKKATLSRRLNDYEEAGKVVRTPGATRIKPDTWECVSNQ